MTRVRRRPGRNHETPPATPHAAFQGDHERGAVGHVSNQAVQRAMRSEAGRPLPASERQFFEPKFGRDFGAVRVHTGAEAQRSAHRLHARAYTSGNQIAFDKGEYEPETTRGRGLLAHELAHTIQQRATTAPAIQRRIGDGHDLTSPRFSKDPVLEAVYDNEQVLQNGNSGPAVRKLQQALVDAGFALPRFGVDGKFGPETEGAVRDFQRASGLIGADRDGIVGPTTLGWLDQRFSTGPTPAGTTHGATTGCAAIRNFNVDFVSLEGATRDPFADLDFANSVFNQCCVRFTAAGGGSESAARSRALLGGDTDLNNTGVNCGTPSAEETGLFNGASADFHLSSPVRVFYVSSISSTDRGYSNPRLCGPAALVGLTGMAVITNSAASRSLAHEFGHILMNTAVHPADTNNLMHPTNTATGEQLTAAQCATI